VTLYNLVYRIASRAVHASAYTFSDPCVDKFESPPPADLVAASRPRNLLEPLLAQEQPDVLMA
jgi:hypothetical protein